MTRFDFPKSVRLLKSSDFDRVFGRKCSVSDGLVIAYFDRCEQARPRLGLVVSRKCGNAVTRNRWKRALREAFRRVQHDLPRGLDIVVLPRRGAQPNVSRLQESLRKLANRAASKLPN